MIKCLLFLVLIYGISFWVSAEPPADENPQPGVLESPTSSRELTVSDLLDKGLAAYETKDYSQAMLLYLKAAKQGSSDAERIIGVFYEKGYGVDQDYREAMKWFKKAVADGNEEARECIKDTIETKKENEETKKATEELKRFKREDTLIIPLERIPGAPNRFNKETLYAMNNFRIVQKIDGGYLITPNMTADQVTDIEFNLAFLKTAKELSSDLIISGSVYYSGDYQYTAVNGFLQSVPLLKIPAGLPLLGRHENGDPFKQDEY